MAATGQVKTPTATMGWAKSGRGSSRSTNMIRAGIFFGMAI